MRVLTHKWFWFCLALSSCAPGVAPPEAPVAPAVSGEGSTGGGAAKPVERARVADELSRLLDLVLPPKAVVSVLPADLRGHLEARVNRLSADQKRALLDPGQPFAYQRPLLHLVAGGTAIGAHTALFASAVAADELGEARQATAQFDDLPQIVSDVARLAAQQVLVKRAADVAPGKTRAKAILGEIAAAADFLGNQAIYLAALAALEQAHPDPEWAFMRAGALARALKPVEAKASLPQDTSVDVSLLRSAETLIAAAEQAVVVPQTAEQAVTVARALLMLDRDEQARATLEPYRDLAANNLALEATMLRALAGSGPCPELRSPLGTSGLCRLTWQRFLTPARLATINQAWRSGVGRDAEATDVWLGMSHVVPMMYGLQHNAEQAVANLAAFRQGALAAQVVGPQYKGIAHLASTLELGLRASVKPSDGATPEIAKTDRERLIRDTKSLVATSADESWTQAAALGAIAVLLPHEDGTPILAQLSDNIRPEWRITHASLLLWNTLANGAKQDFESQKEVLGRAAQTSGEGSYARSRWVILWAEAEALLDPSEKTYNIVNELGQRLKAPEVPLDLRLRTALDVAGLKARKGDFVAALEVLRPLVANTSRASINNRLDQELLIAASGYELVLRALSTEGDERAGHIAALGKLLESVAQASAAPPVLMMWLVLWKGELDALVAKGTCAANAACEQRALRSRGIGTAQFEKVIGPRMAAMLRSGVLPIGGVDLELRYRGGRLLPQVDVDPAFLLVHMPTLDDKRPKGR